MAQVGEYRNTFSIGGSGGYMMNSLSFQPTVTQKMHGGMTFGITGRYTSEKYFSTLCAIQAEVNMAQMGWTQDIATIDNLPDVGEQHMLRVKNGVLLVYADTLSDDADVSITCPKNALFAILTNNQETVAKAVKVEGSAELLTLMMENMNQFPITGATPFNIIEP